MYGMKRAEGHKEWLKRAEGCNQKQESPVAAMFVNGIGTK
jgi:hypothetical protein